MAALRRSVALKVAAFQAKGIASRLPVQRPQVASAADASSCGGGAAATPVIIEKHALDGTVDDFRASLVGLGLEGLFPSLLAAGINCMADVKSYESSTQLRFFCLLVCFYPLVWAPFAWSVHIRLPREGGLLARFAG